MLVGTKKSWGAQCTKYIIIKSCNITYQRVLIAEFHLSLNLVGRRHFIFREEICLLVNVRSSSSRETFSSPSNRRTQNTTAHLPSDGDLPNGIERRWRRLRCKLPTKKLKTTNPNRNWTNNSFSLTNKTRTKGNTR